MPFERSAPRLSANQMAELTVATSIARRMAILREAKYPSRHIMLWYAKVRAAIIQYLTMPRGERDPAVLFELEQQLERDIDEIPRSIPTAHPPRERRKLITQLARSDRSLDVLKRFMSLYQSSDLPKYQFHKPPQPPKPQPTLPLTIEDVDISVSLDLRILAEMDGHPMLGAAVFRFGTSLRDDLRQPVGQHVASLVRRKLALDDDMLASHYISGRLCLAIDVPAQRTIKSPAHFSAFEGQVEEACRFAREHWDSIEP